MKLSSGSLASLASMLLDQRSLHDSTTGPSPALWGKEFEITREQGLSGPLGSLSLVDDFVPKDRQVKVVAVERFDVGAVVLDDTEAVAAVVGAALVGVVGDE